MPTMTSGIPRRRKSIVSTGNVSRGGRPGNNVRCLRPARRQSWASLQVYSPAPVSVAVRYPRNPISFLAGHVACTAQCRTVPASDWGPGPIRRNSENRNSPLRIMHLIMSDRFPKLRITCYGLDPALSTRCMSSIRCNAGLRSLIASRLS